MAPNVPRHCDVLLINLKGAWLEARYSRRGAYRSFRKGRTYETP